MTQTHFCDEFLSVGGGSFARFMSPSNYKNKHSAMENGTYESAAYFFFRERKLGSQSVAAQTASASSRNAAAAAACPSGPAVVGKLVLPDVSGVSVDENVIFFTPEG